MFKKIIGAAVGAKLAKNSPALGGATGAALGAAVPFIISRVSLPAMVALGVGGYVAKRYVDKRDKKTNGSAPTMPRRQQPVSATGGSADIINEPPAGAAGGMIDDAAGGSINGTTNGTVNGKGGTSPGM